MSRINIATLGPEGTDAADLAHRLSGHVRLCRSFREAMVSALDGDHVALVPCGAADVAGELWVDLHFAFGDRLALAGTFVSPTKPMCLAQQKDSGAKKGIALHRATRVFAERVVPDVEVRLAPTKVDAVMLCANGDAEYCIGSADVVERHPQLRPLAHFAPSMVWTVYCLEGRQAEVAEGLKLPGIVP